MLSSRLKGELDNVTGTFSVLALGQGNVGWRRTQQEPQPNLRGAGVCQYLGPKNWSYKLGPGKSSQQQGMGQHLYLRWGLTV